jgi:addiction module HigA family antidote
VRALPSNCLEDLHSERRGQFSTCINMQCESALNGLPVPPAHPSSRSRATTDQDITMRPSVHPGEVRADELVELNITPTGLARQIAVPANRLSQIIRSKRSITGGTALRLGHWFGARPQFWLNLQAAYDIRMAEAAVGAEISRLPVRPWHEKQVGA